MVAKKLLTTSFLIGFLFSWIAFIGCALPPPDPEAQKYLDEMERQDREHEDMKGW
jgi:hypothetical protein